MIGKFTSASALALAMVAAPAAANVKGSLILQDGRPVNGTIRWAGNQYIVIAADGRTTMNLAPDQVKGFDIPRPAELDAGARAVRDGKAADAIAPLESVRRTYKRLSWDIPATRLLAEAYLGMNQPKKAAAMCKELIDEDPAAAFVGDLATIYWESLLRDNQKATLAGVLDRAIQEGTRELAARAQIKRGDMLADDNKHREALVDGYLRTVLLFSQEKAVQPEALYKAARSFEKLGEAPNAEKMRKKLLQEFPDDDYSKRMKAGG